MKKKCLSVCLITLTAAVIAFFFNSYRQTGVHANASAIELLQPGSYQSTAGPIRNLRFTLFDAGIRPNEMRIKAGLVNIHLEDRTSMSQGLVIQRVVASERVAVGTVQKVSDQLRGRTSLRLTPGQYELFDAKQPANKAVLLVEP